MSTPMRRLVGRYLADQTSSRAISRATASNRYYLLAKFADSCPIDPAMTDRRHVRRWLRGLDSLGRSSLRNHISAVRLFLDWMVSEQVIKKNPIRAMGLRAPTEPPRPPRAMDTEELVAIYAVLPDARARCIVTLALQLGLRCIEISRLEVHDIDWSAQTVRVHGKGDRFRDLPLTDDARAAIRDHLAVDPISDGPVVRSLNRPRTALTSGYISRIVVGWIRDAGIKKHPWDGRSAHAFRHTAATDVYRTSGGDLMAVRDMLGHLSVDTTQIYVRSTSLDRLRSVMEGRTYDDAA